jgi:hypothetical protein
VNDRAPSAPAAHLRGLTPEALVERFPEVGFNMSQARRVITRLVHDYGDDLEGIPGLKKTRASPRPGSSASKSPTEGAARSIRS